MSFPTVTDYIRPKDPNNDTYGTHHEQYGIGGTRNTMTVAAMHAIPVEKRRRQMIVSVYSDGGQPALYWLLSPDNTVANLSNNAFWQKIPLGTSFPSGITFKGQFSAVTLLNGESMLIRDNPLSPVDAMNGWFYVCNEAGTANFGGGNQTFNLNDWVIWDGARWRRLAQVSALQWNLITGIPNIILDIASGALQIATQEDFQSLQEQISQLVIPIVVDAISGDTPDAVATVGAIMAYVYSKDEHDQSLTGLLNTITNTLNTEYYTQTQVNIIIENLQEQIQLASEGIQGEFDTLTERDNADTINPDEQWAVLQDGNVYRFIGTLGQSGAEYWEFVRKYIYSDDDEELGGEDPSSVVPASQRATKVYADGNFWKVLGETILSGGQVVIEIPPSETAGDGLYFSLDGNTYIQITNGLFGSKTMNLKVGGGFNTGLSFLSSGGVRIGQVLGVDGDTGSITFGFSNPTTKPTIVWSPDALSADGEIVITNNTGRIRFFITEDNVHGLVVEDVRATPKGIEYSGPGYVTDPRSLADKEYVDTKVAEASGVSIGAGKREYSTTTSEPPSSGQLRLNHATPGSATEAYVHDSDGTTDWSGLLNKGVAGSVLKAIKDDSNYWMFDITGKTDETGYVKYTISPLVIVGTISNEDEVTIELDVSGVDLSDRRTFTASAPSIVSNQVTLNFDSKNEGEFRIATTITAALEVLISNTANAVRAIIKGKITGTFGIDLTEFGTTVCKTEGDYWTYSAGVVTIEGDSATNFEISIEKQDTEWNVIPYVHR